MQKFEVESITLNKDARHEYLIVKVRDSEDHQTREFGLDRTEEFQSKDQPWNEISLIIEVVPRLQYIPLTSPSLAMAASGALASTASVPLLPPSHSGSRPFSMDATPIPPSPITDLRACHRFLGKRMVDYTRGQNVRRFRPTNLNLFQLALLAYVVHKEYPLYSPFKNQPYWYSNIIFDAVILIFAGQVEFDHKVAQLMRFWSRHNRLIVFLKLMATGWILK